MRGNKIKGDKKVGTSVALSPLSLTIMDYERGQESDRLTLIDDPEESGSGGDRICKSCLT